jgi:uncharacterized integral membrane protein
MMKSSSHGHLPLIIVFLNDPVSYSLLIFSKWPWELPLIIVFLNDPVSDSLLFFTYSKNNEE